MNAYVGINKKIIFYSVLERSFVNGQWQWTSPGQPWNYMDGIIGYKNEIVNAGRMHIKKHVLTDIWNTPGQTGHMEMLFLETANLSIQFGTLMAIVKHKWFHLIPRRF